MVCENGNMSVEQGITVLFDINKYLKILIENMLGKENINDKYLYIVGMDASAFRSYYHDVCIKCEEINQIYHNDSGINEAVACPKMMFLFDNMNSCKNFKDYFEKIEDASEKVHNELVYGSTDSVSMTLSIFNPIS